MTIALRKSVLVLDTTPLVCQHFALTPAVAEPTLPPTVRIHPIAFAIRVAAGGDALWQIAAMPIGLAVGFTAIATIAVSV
jgi:hypothetical protein